MSRGLPPGRTGRPRTATELPPFLRTSERLVVAASVVAAHELIRAAGPERPASEVLATGRVQGGILDTATETNPPLGADPLPRARTAQDAIASRFADRQRNRSRSTSVDL